MAMWNRNLAMQGWMERGKKVKGYSHDHKNLKIMTNVIFFSQHCQNNAKELIVLCARPCSKHAML